MKMVEIMASLRHHPLEWGYAQLWSPGGAQLHQDAISVLTSGDYVL